jgi:hypothetical protein
MHIVMQMGHKLLSNIIHLIIVKSMEAFEQLNPQINKEAKIGIIWVALSDFWVKSKHNHKDYQ